MSVSYSHLALCVAALSFVAPSRAGDLADTLADVRGLELGAGAVAVHDLRLEIGGMQIILASGHLAAVRTPTGRAVGYFFEGTGRYRFQVDDPSSQEGFATNAKRFVKPLAPTGRLLDEFASMLALTTDGSFGTLAEELAAAEASSPLPIAARKTFSELRERVFSEILPFDHLYAEAKLNGRGRWLGAVFGGSGRPLGWTHDELRTRREHLYRFLDVSWVGAHVIETVSNGRIDPGPIPPPSWLRLEHANIDVATDDNRSGTIDSELTLRTTLGPATRIVPLRLLNNRDPDSYDWRSERRKLEIVRVTIDGTEVPFSHRYGEVLVELPPDAVASDSIALRFETKGDVFTDINGMHSDSYFQLFGDAWFPVPFGWDAESTRFRVRVRTKKPWRPVASGTRVFLREDGDHWELESTSDRPSYVIAVFGGRYATREEKFGKTTIRVHAYAAAKKRVMETLSKLSAAFLTFYESQLGPYPYEELDIVEVPEYGFGIAPPGMVLITTEAWQPRRDDLAKLVSRGINARLAHEIAHQWFGHLEKPACLEESWLSESFAEYWAGLAMGAIRPDERTVKGFEGMLAEWKGESRYCRDVASLASASSLGGSEGYRDRFCLLYDRGPLVLHMLRTMVGNERFSTISRRLAREADFRTTTTEELSRLATEVVGRDMGWFFDDWVRRGGFPRITVERRVVENGSGGWVLRGRALQPDGAAFRRILIPLVLELPHGREVRLVLQDEPVERFEFPLTEKPKKILVDPFGNDLAQFEP